RFLDDPAVEPTNNRAERALRPAVIARKVSHCSRNDCGANAYATFNTIAVTARQRGIMPQQAILAILKNKDDPFDDSG
ncbi:MAG: transposase, partial [Candidatus Sumerlaeota bacterium]|nr:transposase [Candidatus Sumerlaeota bacterium]